METLSSTQQFNTATMVVYKLKENSITEPYPASDDKDTWYSDSLYRAAEEHVWWYWWELRQLMLDKQAEGTQATMSCLLA